jgi:SagB-type dehydrogenase family enzyme
MLNTKVRGVMFILLGCLLLQSALTPVLCSQEHEAEGISLPKIKPGEQDSFSELMFERRSVRHFGSGEMTLNQVAELVFAAQGITRQDRYRTVPSAGALYPLEIFVLTGPVQGLEAGVYHYQPHGHQLLPVRSGDRRQELARQAYQQMWVAEAQTIVVMCAVYERVTQKYGQPGMRYVHIEAGCAAQNVSLAGYSMGLGSTVVGAFDQKEVAEVIDADQNVRPLIVLPVGLLP